MIKYFYLVDFKYTTLGNYESSLDLGIFSTRKKAMDKVKMSVALNGFKKYNANNFEIIKFGVDFEHNIEDKSDIVLYSVTHEYDNCVEGFSCWNIFDYFSTRKKAMEKVEYLKKHNRIGKKYPNNFDIIEIKVDNFNFWSEGFEELNK